MKIEKGRVVSIHYVLKDEQGDVWETSQNQEPWVYLHGFGGVIAGLEPELEGKASGDSFAITLPPEQAYGLHQHELLNQIPRAAFAEIDNLAVGMRLQGQAEDGSTHAVTVTEITDESVTVDANHPMAGHSVSVEVNVIDVREATNEELEHGQAQTANEAHH